MQAILDYETANNIPKGWVNFAISRAAPDGAWQRLERGEIALDDSFFEQFKQDFHNPKTWEDYHTSFKGRRRGTDNVAQSNNSSQVAAAAASYMIPIPSLPSMDTTTLFWDMMRVARTPDPNIFPALQKLHNSRQFTIGALSNTVPFPADHEFAKRIPLLDIFDVFISSAEVGVRKPHPEIYELAVKMLDQAERKKGGNGVGMQDVCFLDDIGENCRAARNLGMRTIKVMLGRTEDAVKELEEVTGMTLRRNVEDKSKL